MKYFDSFSGIGGFTLGITQAYEIMRTEDKGQGIQGVRNKKRQSSKCDHFGPNRFTCIGYSEIDKYAIQIYQSHFPEHKNYGDITTINEKELPDFELLCGGFPCQSFSIAGKRGGFNDTRGTMFFHIARILKTKQPRLLLLENVKGLLSHDEGKTFATIISTLDELGYDLQWQVLNSKNFGVPQNRERVFIVGHLRGTARPKVFPFTENNSEDIVLPTITTRVTADSNGTYVGKRSPRQIIGGSQTPIVWSKKIKIRRLTPTECERLQGFPDEWTKGISDTQRYKVLGNAVSCPVIKAIAERLLNIK